jgi:hypothetical protein
VKIYWGEKYTEEGDEKRWGAVPLSYWIRSAKGINNLKKGFYIKGVPSLGELATKTIVRFIKLNNWKIPVNTKGFENFVSYVLMKYNIKFYYLRKDIQDLILSKQKYKENIYVYENSYGVEVVTAPTKRGYLGESWHVDKEIDLDIVCRENEVLEDLLSAEDLAKKLRGIMTKEEIDLYASHNWIPHYSYGMESVAFNFKEVTNWIRKNLYRNEGRTLPINYLRLKHTPVPATVKDEPPSVIKDIATLVQVPAGYPPGVYFLCQDNDIVYVGQSINLGARLAQHVQDKVFDKVYFLPTEDYNQVEADYIKILKPKYNKQLYS